MTALTYKTQTIYGVDPSLIKSCVPMLEALWQISDLLRMYPASCLTSAGIGSSFSLTLMDKDGWIPVVEGKSLALGLASHSHPNRY